MNNSNSPVRVGVIGLGMMGGTHLDAYAKMDHVRVVAVADRDPDRLSGKASAAGNIEGQAKGGFDLTDPDLHKHVEAQDLIDDPDVDVVDICLPTPLHLPIGLASLNAGKHTLVEKPLARTFAEAQQLADAAEKAWQQHQAVSMCAMCMRFWPGWDWLKHAVTQQTYGPVRAANFRRVAQFPGGPFYSNGQASGGAILDLHIHDSDFVRHLFGQPQSVHSAGYTKVTGQTDHVLTRYEFPPDTAGLADHAIVAAEGSWCLADGFGFSMRYTVNFEHATADFDLARGPAALQLHHQGKTTDVQLDPAMGYDHELAYFIDCVRQGRPADRVTLRDAGQSVQLVEQEIQSIG